MRRVQFDRLTKRNQGRHNSQRRREPRRCQARPTLRAIKATLDSPRQWLNVKDLARVIQHKRGKCMLSLRDKLKRGALAVLILAPAQATWAQDNKTDLFKVVTVKDEIVIGLSADELKALGGTDASAVAHALAQKGDMTVWQYNVHRGQNGRASSRQVRIRL
jgi:hypothetical protein